MGIKSLVKKHGKLLGILIAGIFLYLAFKNTDFSLVWKNVIQMNFLYLLLSIFFMMMLFFFKGVRWKLLLKPMQDLPLNNVFSSLMIGYFVHNILPFRMGELARIYYLNRNVTVSKTSILGSIIAEKFFDGISLIMIVLITIPLHLGIEDSDLVKAVRIFTFIIMGAAIFYYVARWFSNKFFHHERKHRFQNYQFLVKIFSHFQKFLNGFKALDSFKTTATSSLLSLLIYSLDAVALYVLLLSFGVHQDMMLIKCIIPIIIINIGIMVPSGPGDIGMFHYVGKLALKETFNLDDHISSSIIIIFNFISILPGFILGGYYMVREHIKIDLNKIKTE